MAGPALTEQEFLNKTPDNVKDLSTEEKGWIESIAGHVKNAGHAITVEEATPSASNPIPAHPALDKVGAVIKGGEQEIRGQSDFENVVKIVGSKVSGEEPSTFTRGVPGAKGVLLMVQKKQMEKAA